MSSNPCLSKCFLINFAIFSGDWFGTSLKSNLTLATDGKTVFAPSPVNPDSNPQIVHVGAEVNLSFNASPVTPLTKPRSEERREGKSVYHSDRRTIERKRPG